jgi:hypothetical protein
MLADLQAGKDRRRLLDHVKILFQASNPEYWKYVGVSTQHIMDASS